MFCAALSAGTLPSRTSPGNYPNNTRLLVTEDEPEVLNFLAKTPVQTVILASKLREMRAAGYENQNSFYCHYGPDERLDGVGLFGPMTLFDARSDHAASSFAELARSLPAFKVAIAEAQSMRLFWNSYASSLTQSHTRSEELLFEYRQPIEPRAEVPGLRLATSDDLEIVVETHARMVLEEMGIDRLKEDREGFRTRCAARIASRTIWLLIEEGKLIFKADAAAEIPEAIYIEGLWIDPAERRLGKGLNCLEQLRRNLSSRAPVLCGFANSENGAAQAFYEAAGCTLAGVYNTVRL